MKLILFEDAEANSKQQIYATFVWRAVVVGSGGELACTAVWAVKVSRCPSSPSAGCDFCSREMQKTVKINQSILIVIGHFLVSIINCVVSFKTTRPKMICFY